jgi:hypothetical protein
MENDRLNTDELQGWLSHDRVSYLLNGLEEVAYKESLCQVLILHS